MAQLQLSPETLRRYEFQEILEELVPPDAEVHFQPPDNINLVYPCIIYKRDYAQTRFADNLPWTIKKRYQVTVLDRSPDSEIADKVAKLPSSTFLRHYTQDGLNHDLFIIYY